MADIKSKNKEKESKRGTILTHLTFAPEARSEPAVLPEIGRVKLFWSTFKINNSSLMTANLFFLLFALPLLAVVLFIGSIGAENFSYMLKNVNITPNYMGNIGIGILPGDSVLSAKLNFIFAYRIIILMIAGTIPFLSIGASGLFYITTKIVWKEKFICKKDNFGNDIPRVAKEFFIGVKKYWKQMLLIFTVIGIFVGGFGNLILVFVEANMVGNANFGHWTLLIVSIIMLTIMALIVVHLLPMVAMYDIKFIKKLKNSALLVLALLVPSLFMCALFAIPFTLISSGGFMTMIIMVLLVSFGAGFYGLMFTSFVSYSADVIITPVYEKMQNQHKKKDKKKDKKKNLAQIDTK